MKGARVADSVTRTSCAVCDGNDATILRNLFDDRYGNPDEFLLVECDKCGHVYTYPRLREEQLGDLYAIYYPRKQVDVAAVRDEAALVDAPLARLSRWWNGTDNQGQYAVRRGEHMLDVGSGSCLSLMEATRLGATVRGIEADPNVSRIATELGLQVHIGSLHDDPFPGEQFNLIVLNQVIEHIPEPGLALAHLRTRLAPDGRIVLVFPNIDSFWCRRSGARWINWHVPYHLHHFNLTAFSALAARHGFRVRRWRSITPNLWTVLQAHAMRDTVRRGVPSVLWTSTPAPDTVEGTASAARAFSSLLKRAGRRALLKAASFPLALTNRTLDAFGRGDSLLVEIEPTP